MYNPLFKKAFYDKLVSKNAELEKYSRQEIKSVIAAWVEQAIDIAVLNHDGLSVNKNLGTVFIGKSKYQKKMIKKHQFIEDFLDKNGLRDSYPLNNYLMKVYFTGSVKGKPFSTFSMWKFKGATKLRHKAFWHFLENYNKVMDIDPTLKINRIISDRLKEYVEGNEFVEIPKGYNQFEM